MGNTLVENKDIGIRIYDRTLREMVNDYSLNDFHDREMATNALSDIVDAADVDGNFFVTCGFETLNAVIKKGYR